jgi:hypothetical protein
MPAKYVRPYSKGQKNDYRDAEAIAEAVQRPTMKFVATNTADQLDLQALHRVRERLAHGHHQSDPRLHVGARNRGAARAEFPAGRVAGHPCDAKPMRSRPACCAFSKTCWQTGAAWTRALRTSPARSKRWLVKTKAASD